MVKVILHDCIKKFCHFQSVKCIIFVQMNICSIFRITFTPAKSDFQAYLIQCRDQILLLTAESKGLQLTHVVARELNHPYYAVARKSKKLYMQDGIEVNIESSITTGKEQRLYLSKHDTDLLKGKRVGIVDDVVSTGASLLGLEALVEKAGGIIYKKLFVLAEGEAADRKDVIYLAKIPIL